MMSATSRAQARFRVVTDRANAEDWLPVSESRSTGAPAPPPLAATSRESAQEEYSQVVTDAVVDTLLDEVRDEMGTDTAAVLLRDESEQYLIATAARGIEIEVRQGARVRAGRGFAGRIFAERRPVVLDRISPENVVNPLLLRRGIVSMLGVPLITGEDVIGVVHVGSLTARRFTQDDVRQLERAARRIGRALTRHRSFVDRTAARALQDSLIPTLPELDGVSLAARYVPGSQYGVGGDWYDVFQLPNGLIGITIGDVMGHGLHAATMMGRVRSSLQSYAIEVTCPARVLERLDRKLLHFERGLLCTVCYAIMNPLDGRLVVSAAGHLPPALARAHGAELLDVPVDPPIGVQRGIERRFTVHHLPLDALLCLYTDGVVERRTGDLDASLQALLRALCRPEVTSAEAACAEVMDAMLGNRQPDDDVSLLVVARPSS